MKTKENYVIPQMEEVEFDVNTVMMSNSDVWSDVTDEETDEMDAPIRRGSWGNLWEKRY